MFQSLNVVHIGRNYKVRGVSRRVILAGICVLAVSARGLAQAPNQDVTISELQRQMEQMRSQIFKMQNRITELEAARAVLPTSSSSDPVLLQSQTPIAQATL